MKEKHALEKFLCTRNCVPDGIMCANCFVSELLRWSGLNRLAAWQLHDIASLYEEMIFRCWNRSILTGWKGQQ
jgi:hypothetical protein